MTDRPVLEAVGEVLAPASVNICIGETSIRLAAKNGCHVYDDGSAIIAASDLFRKDPYERIALLERSLEEVMGWIDAWDPNFAQDPDWPGVEAQALAVLEPALSPTPIVNAGEEP